MKQHKATADYLYASTYRRYDLLDVPMFGKDANSHHQLQQQLRHTMRQNVTQLALPGLVAGEHSGNAASLQLWQQNADLWQQFALWLRYSLGYQRFEPFNSYHLHTVVPSPRALYPIAGYLYLNNGSERSWQLWKYQPSEHQFELVGSGHNTSIKADAIQFLLLSDDDRILPYYGDYCATLVALETGHLLAQQLLLAAQLQWQVKQHNQALAGPLCDWLAARPQLQFCAALQSPQWQVASFWPQLQQAKAAVQYRPGQKAVDQGQYPLLQAFRQALRTDRWPQALPKVLAQGTAAWPDLAAALACSKNRTSGNDSQGFVGAGAPLSLSGQLQLWQRLQQLINAVWQPHSWLADLPVRLYCSLVNAEQQNQTFVWTPQSAEFRPLSVADTVTALRQSAATPPHAYNYNSFQLVWSIALDYSALAPYQSHGVVLGQLGVGFLAHLCCLAAADQQLFARPIKGFHEALLEYDMQQLQHSLVYQVLCGHQPKGVPVYEC